MMGRSRLAMTTRPRPTIFLLFICIADDSEGILANFVVRHDVVGRVEVSLVDVRERYELVDRDGVAAVYLERFQLFVINSDINVLLDLIALDDVRLVDLVARVAVDLLVVNAGARRLVDLVD